jgi:hypothetical protein
MAQIHRLPDPNLDNRRLIDVTVGELTALIDAAVQRALEGVRPEESPVSVKVAAKRLGTGEPRVREWCKHGCEECGALLPSTMTGDERGRRLYVSEAREWMQYHRSAGGCLGETKRT